MNAPIIKVSHLSKAYRRFLAVNDISFSVRKGEIFAFLGPNGAGKTTTIKILTTLLRPTRGRVILNGFDPVRQQDQVRRSFGIVFQDPSLDDELTARENMEFHGALYRLPKAVRRSRIQELLTVVELWDRRHDLVKTFSGGMKRRLEIARGLLHHPIIFFLDEPTIGLDPQTRKKIWDYILLLNRRHHTTIFFTTHYLEEAEHMATRLAIIDHGQIVASGNVAQLKHRTQARSLEQAFISLTGKNIRQEGAESFDKLRLIKRQQLRRRNNL